MRDDVAVCTMAIYLAAAALLLCAPESNGTPMPAVDGTRVVATWNGGRLTRDELDRWRGFRERGSAAAASAPSVDDIRELVFFKSLAEVAEHEKLDEVPRVRLQLEAMRRSVLVPALRREVVATISVSEDEVERLQREHPDAYHKPRKLKLRNIYKSFAGSADPSEVRTQMQEIHRMLLDGADFEELARTQSESQSAPRGGTLGWVDPDGLPRAVARVVRELPPGAISPPVEHGNGVSIFLCEDVRQAQAPPPDEVRARLRTELERRRRRQAWSDYQQALLDGTALRIEPESRGHVLELPGYHLAARDLKELLSLGSARTEVNPGTEDKRAILRSWALGVLEVRRAVGLGLDRTPAIAETLHWKRLEVLARGELARRLQAELPDPPHGELRRYFEDHRGRYRQPPAYDLELIDFGAPDDSATGKATLERAMAVARDVAAGRLGFEEAARRYSKHPSAAAGGEIGWKTKQQIALWGPTASRAIFGLSPGGSTGLLHLESGLKMYALRARREARDQSFEEVEDRVRTSWLEAQLPALEEGLRRRQMEAIDLRISSTTTPQPRTIRWSTATEFETYGYDVYRGTSSDGPFQRITKEPVPGAGTSDLPHSYRYEDETALPGKLYFYYVESISTSGHRRRLTPVRSSTGETP